MFSRNYKSRTNATDFTYFLFLAWLAVSVLDFPKLLQSSLCVFLLRLVLRRSAQIRWECDPGWQIWHCAWRCDARHRILHQCSYMCVHHQNIPSRMKSCQKTDPWAAFIRLDFPLNCKATPWNAGGVSQPSSNAVAWPKLCLVVRCWCLLVRAKPHRIHFNNPLVHPKFERLEIFV